MATKTFKFEVTVVYATGKDAANDAYDGDLSEVKGMKLPKASAVKEALMDSIEQGLTQGWDSHNEHVMSIYVNPVKRFSDEAQILSEV